MSKTENKENIKLSSSEEEKKKVSFSPIPRFILYVVLLSVEMALNCGSGILSSSSKQIKLELKLNDKQFGMFGTAFGIGRGTGSFLFTIIINKFNLKWLYIFYIFFKGLFMILFNFSNNGIVLITLRGLIGVLHMGPTIYLPIWIDQYAFKKYKTTQLTMFQVIKPFGKVMGYTFNVLLGEKNWKYGFVITGGYLWSVSLLIFCYPQNYFNGNLKANKEEEDDNRNTIYEYLPKVKKEEEKSYFEEMYECLTSPIFQVANWTRGIIDGFLTAVHYWCADYMRNALGVNDPKLIFLSYTTACITGPVIGGFVGQIVNYLYGSYENPGAPYVCIGLQILVTIFGISATFMSNLYTFVGCLTLFLCFVSAVLSLCIGFLIVSVRPGLKSISNAISNITMMFLLSGTSPMIYGAVNDYFKPKGLNRMAMRFIMSANIVGILLLLIFGRMRKNQLRELKKENNENLIKGGKELEEK